MMVELLQSPRALIHGVSNKLPRMGNRLTGSTNVYICQHDTIKWCKCGVPTQRCTLDSLCASAALCGRLRNGSGGAVWQQCAGMS